MKSLPRLVQLAFATSYFLVLNQANSAQSAEPAAFRVGQTVVALEPAPLLDGEIALINLLATVQQGDVLTVQEVRNEWIKVAYKGKSGWIPTCNPMVPTWLFNWRIDLAGRIRKHNANKPEPTNDAAIKAYNAYADALNAELDEVIAEWDRYVSSDR